MLRGGSVAGRCVPGRRSANGGQCVCGDGARSEDHSRDQQDRSFARAEPTRWWPRCRSLWDTDPEEVIKASAKAGLGIEPLLRAIVERIPAPDGNASASLQAMVFDSHYDDFRGAITYIRVMNGT